MRPLSFRRVYGHLLSAALLSVGISACAMPTAAEVDVVDLRGTWQLTAEQSAPAASLEGTLLIEQQEGDLILGSASWSERDGIGTTVWRAGAVSGRVIESTDVDFDIVVDGVARRHVARLSSDTMSGSWIEFTSGARGSFRAVRGTP